MKRLLVFTPLLLVLAACGGTKSPSTQAGPILSHATTLDEVPLKLDVIGLRRTAGIASVDLRLANRAPHGGDAFSIGDTFSADGLGYNVGGVLLLDPATGQPMTPLGADEADLGMAEVAPGGTQTIRAVFRAPRGDKADILVPHFGLFRDVPVR